MATNLINIENDQEIKQRLAAERARLRKIAGLDQPDHFHRPVREPSLRKSVIRSRFCSVALPGSTRI